VPGGSANIRSPDVLKRFRHRYLEFDAHAHLALDSMSGDVSSVLDWLRKDQLVHWRAALQKRHEEMQNAWREYVNARHGDRRMGKPSSVDERKAYEKARRLKEEAERKIDLISRWAVALEREATRLLPPCLRLDAMLSALTPKAVARLDHMLDNLAEYLRPSSAPAAE
jgi:hypothetical protein